MRRLTILAKGNADVRDSLHALIEDGAATWNGINACLRERPDGVTARVLHETMTRSDAVLALPRAIPDGLADAPPPLGAFPVAAQFATRLFAPGHDAIILSIQADVMHRLVRHRDDGHLLYPHDLNRWPEPARRRLTAAYDPVPPLTPDAAMANLAAIVARVRQASDAPVLVCNLSPVLPWERIHSYLGLDETLGLRIRRFNLALIELSRETGVAIVDVESVVAREGAVRLKRDAVTLTAAGCRAVAFEVVRVLDDLGCLARDRLAPSPRPACLPA